MENTTRIFISQLIENSFTLQRRRENILRGIGHAISGALISLAIWFIIQCA